MSNNPCPQCPWRKANQGKPHPSGFYTGKNLTRLWNQIRRGGAPQSCHLTDPRHPDHLKAGCPPDAQVRECPGAMILVLREIKAMAKMGAKPDLIDQQTIEAYLNARKRGLTRNGILYWLISRMELGGAPIIGGGTFPRGGARKLVIPESISDTESRK